MLEKKPDAVRSPLHYAGAGDSFSRLSTLQAELSQILVASHTFVRHQGTEHFISGDVRDTLNYPSLSARAGESRYDWHDRGDGVLYGYLKES